MPDYLPENPRLRRFLEALVAISLCAILGLVYIFLYKNGQFSSAADYVAAAADLLKSLIPNIIAVILIFLILHWYTARIEQYSETKKPLSVADSSATISAPSPVRDSFTSESLAVADSVDISAFVTSLNANEVTSFRILAISGGVTVRSFLNAMERSSFADKPVECRFLLRSPLSTDRRRSQTVAATQADLRRFQGRHPTFKQETRTYGSTTPLHCVIAEHRDGRSSAYLAFYDWTTLNAREGTGLFKRLVYAATANEPLLRVYLSWFNHFWGIHKIHTVLFDFDDTLFLTTGAQAQAWAATITWALQKKIIKHEDLMEDVRSACLRNQNLVPIMTEIFLDEQDEESIFARIFENDVGDENRALLRNERIKRREQLTATEAIPIPGIIHDLHALRLEYQLVIVSATAESLIARILERHGLDVIFSFILGREAMMRKWQFVENKAQHFIRVSNMLGIPLERMVFVGDSDADYRAATQLGLRFIENRFNAARHNRRSLIKTVDAKIDHFISKDASEGELVAQIKRMEAEIEI